MKKQNNVDDSSLLACWLPVLQAKMRMPACIVLGSPKQVAELIEAIPVENPVDFQFDLHQAERVTEAVRECGKSATVATHQDPWDLGPQFQTVIFPVEPQGERMLKVDMIEQAYHI